MVSASRDTRSSPVVESARIGQHVEAGERRGQLVEVPAQRVQGVPPVGRGDGGRQRDRQRPLCRLPTVILEAGPGPAASSWPCPAAVVAIVRVRPSPRVDHGFTAH